MAWEQHELASLPCGRAWDAVRIPTGAGWQVLRALQAQGKPLGPVLLTARGVEFLVAPGSADAWDLPGSEVLAEGAHIIVPDPQVIAPMTIRATSWLVAPSNESRTTRADDLYECYAATLASRAAAEVQP
ncbi:hypothetical protein ACFVJK_42875 [Streptomyces sp. NPDC127172]|uniref:hypothetical protein n=1 Tax=Streptomyces sp. NPDC127172 TaxID=3345382 RepID=UPI003635048B